MKNVCRVSYSATLGICLSFAECNTRRKGFLKKTKYCLKNVCRVSYSATLGICLSFAERSTRRKGILKTKKYFYKTICRVPCHLTLGEVTVNGGSGVTTVYFRRELNCTRQNVCRVPDIWHSAKLALPIYGECYSPSVALGELFAECFT